MKKKISLVLAMFVFVTMAIGCASMGKTEMGKAVTTYELAVATIVNLDKTAQQLIQDGVLKGEDKIQYEKIYRIVYYQNETVADALSFAIKMGNKESFDSFEKALATLAENSTELKAFIDRFQKK